MLPMQKAALNIPEEDSVARGYADKSSKGKTSIQPRNPTVINLFGTPADEK